MRDPMEAFESWLERRPRLWALWLRHNFCKGVLADGSPKPESRLFAAFSRAFHLECPCCAALRGIIAGLALGLAIGLIGG